MVATEAQRHGEVNILIYLCASEPLWLRGYHVDGI